jgi:LysM domain
MTLHRHSSFSPLRRRALLAVFLGLLGLAACGGPQFMPSAQDDDDTGVVHNAAADNAISAPPPVFTPAPEEWEEPTPATPAQPVSRRASHHHRRPRIRGAHGKLSMVAVRPGDTLWIIALRQDVYGSGWLYPLIYKANRDLLPDPSHPAVGTLLKVPRGVPDAEIEKAEEEAMTGQFLDQSPLPQASPTAAPPVPTAVPAPPTPEAAAQSTPLPAPPSEGRPQPGFGGAGWTLMFLLLALLAVVAFMRLRPDDTEGES